MEQTVFCLWTTPRDPQSASRITGTATLVGIYATLDAVESAKRQLERHTAAGLEYVITARNIIGSDNTDRRDQSTRKSSW
jgi:hypothetical protein